MRTHVGLGLGLAYPEALPRILARAGQDPRILHLDRGPAGHHFVFCHSGASAALERQRFEETGSVGFSLCVLVVDPFGVRLNQECADDSRLRMAPFVIWMLKEFAPCTVYDEDADEDISAAVRADPMLLFD
jgi:hypothetical protein